MDHKTTCPREVTKVGLKANKSLCVASNCDSNEPISLVDM